MSDLAQFGTYDVAATEIILFKGAEISCQSIDSTAGKVQFKRRNAFLYALNHTSVVSVNVIRILE